MRSSNSYSQRPGAALLPFLAVMVTVLFSLGCSIGALVVQVPTPTPTVFKTPRPTYTITPPRTATFTPSPTSTPTPTLTPTATPTPTVTAPSTPAPEKPAQAEAPAAPAEPAAPAAEVEPPPTPTPAEPTATATPAFPFQVVPSKHDTGSPGETRITGWVRVDYSPGNFKTLSGFQMKVTAPDGNTYLSDLSGSGTADSTSPGAGDDHPMNCKIEVRPYTAGTYKIMLEENGVQVSPEVEFTLNAEPRQYIHFEFFKNEPK